jgi:CheY-like chemotaxis protein
MIMHNILIIDDEDAVLLVIKDALGNFGFNVEILPSSKANDL